MNGHSSHKDRPIKPDADEIILRTPLFAVDRRTLVSASGRKFDHYRILHPGAVVVLPILPDGRIILIRNHRRTVDEHLLELPAGTLEPGESPAECAARECLEETGFNPARVDSLGYFYTSPGILAERMYAFVATGLTEQQQNLDEHEEIEVGYYSLDEIRQRLTDGEFFDGKTIAVLASHLLRTSPQQ